MKKKKSEKKIKKNVIKKKKSVKPVAKETKKTIKKVTKKIIKKSIIPKKSSKAEPIIAPSKKVVIDKSIKKANYTKIIKIPSGIKNLDPLMGGGFEEKSLNLLVGGSGAGKTVFGLQFLVEGIKKGNAGLYISFEEKKETFYRNMYSLGFDLEKLEKQGKFFFLEYTPQKVKTMLEEGGGAIETLVLTKKIKRLVMDNLTSFMLMFEKDVEKKDAGVSLANLIRRWDCTTILDYEENLTPGNETERMIDLEMDSITLLYFIGGGAERKRSLEILKMRSTSHSLKLHPFRIEKGGIVVGKARTSKKEKKKK